MEGCFVQIAVLAAAGILIWAAFASGFVVWVSTGLAHWMVGQMRFGPTPSP